ncbi:hypothetical protein A7U60_g3456 [Sanghuangporus baumii]|uniref:Proteophosphoglycan ppg4 n=1 Tax=Sanghuangporus baumii TaxID=108892 RepID=A0A9Q5I0C9_SANBA|nr:hypothetical protein A7U60_g3456 [Sanghuangporus baumii]
MSRHSTLAPSFQLAASSLPDDGAQCLRLTISSTATTLSPNYSADQPAQTPPSLPPPRKVKRDVQTTSRRILLMGFTFGSLAVMSGFRPLEHLSVLRVSTLFELKSMLLSVLVLFVLLVLAYLTNPSEASFRAFLTEQAFRHHLSRLDDVDAQDDSESASVIVKPGARLRRGLSSSSSANRSITSYAAPPFAFASRASVSLRTPKHIFRSFGILSVAAVVPTSPSNRSSSIRRQTGDEIATRADKESGTGSSSSIFDSWFIGAFGMWFWTFNLDGLWRDAGLVAKDDVDGTVTGVLAIKALDRSDECNRTSYAIYGNDNSNHTQRTRPKLRSRERSTHQNGNTLNHRSQTPPPLPKSASLPLHTKRGSHVSSPEKASTGRSNQSNNSFALSSAPSIGIQPPISITPEFRSINTSAPPVLTRSTSSSSLSSRSPSALFASSPLIAELLRQLSSSQNAISDLGTQISDFNSTSASTRAGLDDELERQRERKRADDAAKVELKAQTKTLEDQKRTNEATRRDAEKRLRTVQSEKDNTDARIERYEHEIDRLQSQMDAQGASIVESTVQTSVLVAELEQQIEDKRSEVRVTEDEVAQLSLRLREMEENVANEEQRLKEATAEMEERRAKSLPCRSQDNSNAVQRALISEHVFTQPQASLANTIPSEGTALPLSPIRTAVPDSPLNATSADAHAHRVGPITMPLDANLANGFPMLSSAFHPHNQTNSVSHTFSPFSSDLASPGPLSPTGESLIPSSLYESLGMPISSKPQDSPVTASELSVSRSFQSEDDMILDRNWLNRRNSAAGDVGQPMTFAPSNGAVHNSPVSPASSHGYVYDMDHPARGRTTSVGLDAQRASFPSRLPTSDFTLQQALSNTIPVTHVDQVEPASVATTRRSGWFTSHKDKNAKTQEKKGLNPDAKEFSLSKEKERSFSAFLSRSRGSGHGSGSGSGSGSSSTPSSASIPTPEPPPLGNSPALTSAVTVKNPSPQMHHMAVPARTAGSFFGLGSSLFGSRAFAPTPFEREQLSRALGGTANSSLEKLERWPSLPTSPQARHHALALAQNQSVVSLPQLGAWDAAGTGTTATAFGPLGAHSSVRTSGSGFCPFDDESTATGATKVTDSYSSSPSQSSPSSSSSLDRSGKERR